MAAPLTQRDNTGVVTGVVTRVDDQGRPYLEVPRVAPGFEFGPVLSAAGELAAGDRVVAGFIEGLPDAPVILARVPGPRGASPTAHTHDDRYYTEAEVTALLAGKAASTHSHAFAGTWDAIEGNVPVT